MRILMTGPAGLLGGRLAVLLARRFAVTAARHDAPGPAGLPEVPLDLLSEPSLEAALDAARPDAILHSAALADPDRCEADPEAAERLNVEACAALARLSRARGIRLVALSTDLVFDGSSGGLREDQPARPLLEYGRSKLLGERAVLAEARDAVVLRVALVAGRGFGPRATASEAVAWALRAGRRLRLFSDQHRSPVDPESIAQAAASACAGRGQGLYHVGGAERLSRLELGLRVAACLGLDSALIEAASQQAAPLVAPRPLDVSLDSGRARRELGYDPRPLDAAIREGRASPEG
jgi:dTDP-4-dehydrorhamnose reductase